MQEELNKVPPNAKWLRLSEEKNALDYLEKAAFFIRKTPEDHINWKWVILGLHGSLYGFTIAACRGTDSQSVVSKEGKLINFWKALELCQDPNHMKMLIYSKPLILSESQKKSIRQLKSDFRNEFEHFRPKGWSIEVHDMPEIAIDVLEAIRFVALETNTFVHLSDTERTEVKSLVDDSLEFLRKSVLYKELLTAKELYET